MLADFGLRFVFIVLLLSGLSFLGLGVQPPDADWGSLVRENIEGLAYGAPAVIMPAIAIATLTARSTVPMPSIVRIRVFTARSSRRWCLSRPKQRRGEVIKHDGRRRQRGSRP